MVELRIPQQPSLIIDLGKKGTISSSLLSDIKERFSLLEGSIESGAEKRELKGTLLNVLSLYNDIQRIEEIVWHQIIEARLLGVLTAEQTGKGVRIWYEYIDKLREFIVEKIENNFPCLKKPSYKKPERMLPIFPFRVMKLIDEGKVRRKVLDVIILNVNRMVDVCEFSELFWAISEINDWIPILIDDIQNTIMVELKAERHIQEVKNYRYDITVFFSDRVRECHPLCESVW